MTTQARIYCGETEKPVSRFIEDFIGIVSKKGFVIQNESTMDMARTFGRHGVEVDPGFDLHMVQICKPQKAGKSLSGNPERSVLMPKFVMVFSRNGRTQIRFLRYSPELVAALVDDAEFPASLEESFETIVALIREAE